MRIVRPLLLLLILAVIAVAILFLEPFLRQDACLDAGGMWQDGVCIGRRPGG